MYVLLAVRVLLYTIILMAIAPHLNLILPHQMSQDPGLEDRKSSCMCDGGDDDSENGGNGDGDTDEGDGDNGGTGENGDTRESDNVDSEAGNGDSGDDVTSEGDSGDGETGEGYDGGDQDISLHMQNVPNFDWHFPILWPTPPLINHLILCSFSSTALRSICCSVHVQDVCACVCTHSHK